MYHHKQLSSPKSRNFLRRSSGFTGNPLLAFAPVSDQFALEIPKKTPPKLCEHDPILTKLLFDDIDVLLPTVTHIINTSLSSGSVPLEPKTAVVKPRLKKPSSDKHIVKI